ncbi:MAG: copper transporter [Firmicutes bacterium]|nr:copper transporter [Bacillota bacterium]
MITFRHHIASTVAIFFALGLGIFLGSIIVKDDTLVRHQQTLIDRIESEFTLIRKDREALYAKLVGTESLLENSIAFGEMALTKLICGRLDGKRIAMVVPGQGLSHEETATVTASLRDAGARVTQVVYVTKRLEPVTSEDAKGLGAVYGISKPSCGTVGQKLADSVAALVVQDKTSYSPEIDTLLRTEYLEIDLFETAICDAVIIAGGSRDPAHTPIYTDIPLVKAFQELGMPAVIAESRNADFSFITEYQRQDIPTIEQVDTPMGRFALIEQLANIIHGD